MRKDHTPHNEIQQWIDSDKVLSDVLVEIQEMPISLQEQAEVAFHRISEMYGVPKMPEDIVYDNDEESESITSDNPEQSSVYEQLGLFKYLHPDDDPRGLVLAAIYAVINNLSIDMGDIYNKKYGRKTPTLYGIGWIGENSKVEIIFIEKGESWYDAGCKVFVKFDSL